MICPDPPVENYFNYFTEIEEHFQKRRGTTLLLSTLDWALIESWKEAGIPLEAVLRGIDAAFDRYDRRSSRTRKVNSLAFCSQEVLAVRAEADRDLAPYRRKMSGPQIEQLLRQYMRKRLFDRHRLPRLSLFYMT